MADEAQAQTPASDAAAAAEKPVIDMDAVTLDQLDELLGGKGTAELPMMVTGGEQAGQTPPVKEEPAKEEPKAKVVEDPPAAAVEETRTPEVIETEKSAARERVQAEGGDEAAQDAAAEEAGQPGFVAPVVEPPKKVEDEDKGDRFRYSDPTDRAINALYRARKGTANEVTWAEAERLVKGDAPAAAAPAVEEVDHGKIVGDLETEVADLKKKLDDAGANEGVFDATISKLAQDFAEKTADLKLAKRDQRIANEQAEAEARRQVEQSDQARAKAKAQAIEDYPSVADDQSPLAKAVAADIAAMRNPNHPDHSILYADSAALILTEKWAKKLGIQPVAKKKAAAPPATPPATPPAVPPKSKVSPPSGAKTSVTTAQPQEDAKKYVEHLKSPAATLEQLDEVFEPGGQQKTLQAVVGG